MITEPPGPVSFSEHVLPVLQTGCDGAGCHIGFQVSGTELSTFDAVVGSIGVQYGEAIVKSGDATGSALFDKLLSTPRFGQRMPIGTQLSASDIDLIKKWINEGARDN